MSTDGNGFTYLRQKFPRISEAKMKEGSFVGLQVMELFKDDNFKSQLSAVEARALEAFESRPIRYNFLGNNAIAS